MFVPLGFHFKDLRLATQPSQAPVELMCTSAGTQEKENQAGRTARRNNHKIDASSICEQGRETRNGSCKANKATFGFCFFNAVFLPG